MWADLEAASLGELKELLNCYTSTFESTVIFDLLTAKAYYGLAVIQEKAFFRS